jgi:hypothetical protein
MSNDSELKLTLSEWNRRKALKSWAALPLTERRRRTQKMRDARMANIARRRAEAVASEALSSESRA